MFLFLSLGVTSCIEFFLMFLFGIELVTLCSLRHHFELIDALCACSLKTVVDVIFLEVYMYILKLSTLWEYLWTCM